MSINNIKNRLVFNLLCDLNEGSLCFCLWFERQRLVGLLISKIKWKFSDKLQKHDNSDCKVIAFFYFCSLRKLNNNAKESIFRR